MSERELIFTCAYCQKDTTILLRVEKTPPRQSKPISLPRYCEHCHKPNKVAVPDNIEVHVFILGRDEGFLGYTPEGLARLQGEKEL